MTRAESPATLGPPYLVIVIVTMILISPLLFEPSPNSTHSETPKSAGSPSVQVVAWNDLGMHCLDPDFSVFAVLPPYNTINAQVIEDGQLVTQASPYAVTFEAQADSTGSINTTSIGKTNFWSHVNVLFGTNPPVDTGLTGTTMPGSGNIPQAMVFDPTHNWFQAEGIPMTPYDDALVKNPYPLMRVVVRNAQGQVVASTLPTAPNSTELECSRCHSSGGSPFAEPAAGWVYDPAPLRDDRLNILRLHDERHLPDPVYQAALLTSGYSNSGLFATATGGTAVLCARCHGSNALTGTGLPGISPLTQAIHSRHALVIDEEGETLESRTTRESCFLCHPGRDTQCLRGAMGTAIGTDGMHSMECQSCHGSMQDVADPNRVGWLDQPNCQNCHSGTATNNGGEIRFTSAYDQNGSPRTPADPLFATNPDVPAPGFSLYRFSEGHGGLQCSACHGPPHAIYPTALDNDNVQNQALQGHVGTLTDCQVCHDNLEDDEIDGPHGMHPVSQDWARDEHGDAAQRQGLAYCQQCHGAQNQGTVLSRAQGDRTYNTSLGTKTFWRGSEISCYACHQGPNNSNAINNSPPSVPAISGMTPSDVPLTVSLNGTDPNGDALTFRIVSQPRFREGTVAINGSIATFRAEPGFVGTTTFAYAARDGKIDSNLGIVTVTVLPPSCSTLVADYGFGCPGSGDFLPRLQILGCPERGTTVQLSVDRGLGGALAAIAFGTARGNYPSSFGCTIRIDGHFFTTDPFVLNGAGSGNGSGLLPFLIPQGTPAGRYTLQAFVVDPNAPGGLASTQGIEVTIP